MSKHKRSPQAKTRQKIIYSLKTVIREQSFRDPIWAETICTTSHVTLRDLGYEMFGESFSCSFIPDVDQGYVLADSRGRGCDQ